ncbi:MAG: DNA alkylation repair protein [Candidatus Eisenbacteria bacterium]
MMTKGERSALRAGAAEAVAGLSAEQGDEAARRLLPLILPDPKAPVSRGGLRVSRDVILEVVDTLGKKIRSKEKLRAVTDGLWGLEADEARTAAALALGPLLPTGDDESEARSVQWVKELAASTSSPVVLDALADTLSREMERGATDSWARAFKVWRKDPDRRFRILGLGSFTHLLSRGRTPEKLFDAFMLGRRLAGDGDDEVRHAVVGLFVTGGRKQPRAARRFLDRMEEDGREEVKGVVEEARAKIPEPEEEGAAIAGGETDTDADTDAGTDSDTDRERPAAAEFGDLP